MESCGEFCLESEPILHEGYEVSLNPKVVEGVVSGTPCVKVEVPVDIKVGLGAKLEEQPGLALMVKGDWAFGFKLSLVLKIKSANG